SRINELQTAVAEEAHSGDRLARLEELIVDGWPMLETADIPTANAFFRHHLEIWVDHGRVAEIKAI
ncbi:MAG: hypothetical protein KDE53_04690, partial [Caldilineaceae bacterium]|nr:hypothetical protein [Caldilineaceae bacterium]